MNATVSLFDQRLAFSTEAEGVKVRKSMQEIGDVFQP
jgi:hypothetical protein